MKLKKVNFLVKKCRAFFSFFFEKGTLSSFDGTTRCSPKITSAASLFFVFFQNRKVSKKKTDCVKRRKTTSAKRTKRARTKNRGFKLGGQKKRTFHFSHI
jgi:hypothetical protein